MKQMMTGYMPFGARRTMTQGSNVDELEEEEKDLDEVEEQKKLNSLRTIISSLVRQHLNKA